ncbi:hypothetical protein ACFE04_029915 [Oxalis oulophora]
MEKMRGNWLSRQYFLCRSICYSSSSPGFNAAVVNETLISKPSKGSSFFSTTPIFNNTTTNVNFQFNTTNPYFIQSPRPFSSQGVSDSKPDASNIVVVNSAEEFDTAFRKAEGESSPSIFYYTAEWCAPCRYLSPVFGQLMEAYPQVTTYKIDIDKESLQKKLSELGITSVPTLHFYQNGKKEAEVVGADVQRLRGTVAELYK